MAQTAKQTDSKNPERRSLLALCVAIAYTDAKKEVSAKEKERVQKTPKK